MIVAHNPPLYTRTEAHGRTFVHATGESGVILPIELSRSAWSPLFAVPGTIFPVSLREGRRKAPFCLDFRDKGARVIKPTQHGRRCLLLLGNVVSCGLCGSGTLSSRTSSPHCIASSRHTHQPQGTIAAANKHMKHRTLAQTRTARLCMCIFVCPCTYVCVCVDVCEYVIYPR